MHDDLYQALWVPRDASDEEIKRAYYALSRQCHPDLNPNDDSAKKKFQRIQRAFEILGDPVKRESYNREYDAKYRNIPLPQPPPRQVSQPGEIPVTSGLNSVPPVQHPVAPRPFSTRYRKPNGASVARILSIIVGGIAGILLAVFMLSVSSRKTAEKYPVRTNVLQQQPQLQRRFSKQGPQKTEGNQRTATLPNLPEAAREGAPVTLLAAKAVRADPDIYRYDSYWGGGTTHFSWAEWEFQIDVAGKWFIYVLMASGEPRPGTFFINGEPQSPQVLADITGGFHLRDAKWVKCGPYVLKVGKNVLRLQFPRHGPHIKGFYFSQSEHPKLSDLNFDG